MVILVAPSIATHRPHASIFRGTQESQDSCAFPWSLEIPSRDVNSLKNMARDWSKFGELKSRDWKVRDAQV